MNNTMASKLRCTEICKVCLKKVIDKGVECDGPCKNWYHPDCMKITSNEYKKIAEGTTKSWTCDRYDCVLQAADPIQDLSAKMTALLNSFATLATKSEIKTVSDGISDLKNEISALREEFNSIEPRLKATEERLDALEGKLGDGPNVTFSSNYFEDILAETNDRANRARNIIVYNLPENTSADTKVRVDHDKKLMVQLIQATTSDKIQIGDIKLVRVGKHLKNKNRPLKVIFRTDCDAQTFNKHFSHEVAVNTDATLFANVSISRDRTLRERNYFKKLKSELELRTSSGERGLSIRYHNGIPTIVTIKKNE